jgi:hypothetical protein
MSFVSIKPNNFLFLNMIIFYQQNKIITSYLKSWNIKKFMTYGIGNPGPGLRQAQKCDWVKLVNGIPKIWEEQ